MKYHNENCVEDVNTSTHYLLFFYSFRNTNALYIEFKIINKGRKLDSAFQLSKVAFEYDRLPVVFL
jgi:hypothetical protein